MAKSNIDKAAGCWLWNRGCDKNGYGKTSISVGGITKHTRAHRMMWELVNGPIPDGQMVCHTCDVPSCINPDHLFLGDALANMRDKIAKGRARYSVGEEHPGSKLTREDVDLIRYMFAEGHGRKELADLFHVSPKHVWAIITRKVWKDGA